jgi:hypothetical protein
MQSPYLPLLGTNGNGSFLGKPGNPIQSMQIPWTG